MNKHTVLTTVVIAGLSIASVPAQAVDGPKPVEFDGGPLGTPAIH